MHGNYNGNDNGDDKDDDNDTDSDYGNGTMITEMQLTLLPMCCC